MLNTPENKIEDTERYDHGVLKLAKVLLARLLNWKGLIMRRLAVGSFGCLGLGCWGLAAVDASVPTLDYDPFDSGYRLIGAGIGASVEQVL